MILIAACASEAEQACYHRYYADIDRIDSKNREYAEKVRQDSGQPKRVSQSIGALQHLELSASYHKKLARNELERCLANP